MGLDAKSRRCARCLIPESFPGLDLGPNGLCAACKKTPPEDRLAGDRRTLRAELEEALDRRRGARPYEAIVAFSGGKDSSYTLRYLSEELGLRCLAITVDNGFVARGARENCTRVCDSLGVDHVFFKPASRFMEGMYRASIERADLHPPASTRRASAICASCISLINAHMLQRAIQLRAPIVAGGYLGGQVPRNGAMIAFREQGQAKARSAMVARFGAALGKDAEQYFELPPAAPDAHEILIVNPMLALAVDEDEIKTSLAPLGWIQPNDTGMTSTNCLLNDLGVFLHMKRHGFHPYAMETAEQLREGTISREKAEAKLGTVPSAKDVRWLADRIGVDLDGA